MCIKNYNLKNTVNHICMHSNFHFLDNEHEFRINKDILKNQNLIRQVRTMLMTTFKILKQPKKQQMYWPYRYVD